MAHGSGNLNKSQKKEDEHVEKWDHEVREHYLL